MELEVGLKMTKVVDDFISSTDLLIAKDRSGPLFVSRETDSMFILTAHLKGFKRERLKIEINEDGTRISISGEKLVQETVLVGRKIYKKETEMRGFRKVFKIPDGVILDKIKARFDEEESVLTISMPKAVKGIRGGGVEEVKEEQQAESSKSDNPDQGLRTIEPARTARDQASRENEIETYPTLVEKDHQVVEGSTSDEMARVDTESKEEKTGQEIDKIDTPRPEQVTGMVGEVEAKEEVEKRGTDIEGKDHTKEAKDVSGDEPLEKVKEKSLGDEATQGDQPPERRQIMCVPIIAGSALLVSIIVLVFHLIRNRNPPRKTQN